MAWGACRALAAPGGGSPMAGAAYALSAGLVSLLFAGWLARTLRRRKADRCARPGVRAPCLCAYSYLTGAIEASAEGPLPRC